MSNPIRQWYSFYPEDYRTSTWMMTDEEDLLYRRMLDFYWEQECNVSAKELRNIAKVLGYQLRKFQRVWAKVSPKFPEVSGKLTNPRMDAEFKKAKEKHRSASEKGKKGGRPKESCSLSSGKAQKVWCGPDQDRDTPNISIDQGLDEYAEDFGIDSFTGEVLS